MQDVQSLGLADTTKDDTSETSDPILNRDMRYGCGSFRDTHWPKGLWYEIYSMFFHDVYGHTHP